MCVTSLNVFTNWQVCRRRCSYQTLLTANNEDCYFFCFFYHYLSGGQVLYSVYSALGINMGFLSDMYVLSRLMSYVCSLRSKGQFVDLLFDE